MKKAEELGKFEDFITLKQFQKSTLQKDVANILKVINSQQKSIQSSKDRLHNNQSLQGTIHRHTALKKQADELRLEYMSKIKVLAGLQEQVQQQNQATTRNEINITKMVDNPNKPCLKNILGLIPKKVSSTNNDEESLPRKKKCIILASQMGNEHQGSSMFLDDEFCDADSVEIMKQTKTPKLEAYRAAFTCSGKNNPGVNFSKPVNNMLRTNKDTPSGYGRRNPKKDLSKFSGGKERAQSSTCVNGNLVSEDAQLILTKPNGGVKRLSSGFQKIYKGLDIELVEEVESVLTGLKRHKSIKLNIKGRQKASDEMDLCPAPDVVNQINKDLEGASLIRELGSFQQTRRDKLKKKLASNKQNLYL